MTQVIELDDEVMCIHIPPFDDTFECQSHEAIAVVHAPNGTFLFSKANRESSANTWQSDRLMRQGD